MVKEILFFIKFDIILRFDLIFKLLKEINFDGLYTLQTARMEDGKELETIKRHKKIIEGIYND